MKYIVLKLIKLYQATLSFDHGILSALKPYGQCKFHPSCSMYAYQSIEKHGLVKGIVGGVERIVRCHPWSDGGYDPVK